MSGPLYMFAGTFDPPHLGHLDVLQRAAGLARSGGGEVLMAIADNPEKRNAMSLEVRMRMLEVLCATVPGSRAVTFRGATVTYARDHGVTTLVRGLRNPLDFEHEKAMAEINRSHGLDTVFFMTSGAHAHLSSQLVRSVQAAGLPITPLVPPTIASLLDGR